MKYCLILILFLLACKDTPAVRQRGVYYWKTALSITPFLQESMAQSGVQRIFIKFADIGRNTSTGTIEPYALLHARDTSGLGGLDIVPCFFITNIVFANADEGTTGWLAERLEESLESVGAQWGKKAQEWPEIQLDCDWTAQTRKPYFTFIRQLQRRLPGARLNITIRLHQYRDPDKTGVPPAQRGTLMCYNTGDIEDENTKNSIFDLKDVQKYANSTPYPLPLDLALPIFSWALIYRDSELWRIVPEPMGSAWADTTNFVREKAYYRVRKAHFFGGHYLAKNDRIRVETVLPQDLQAGSAFFEQLHLAPDATILLYHLDSVALARTGGLQSVFEILGH